MTPAFQVKLKIRRPRERVFQAVVDPGQLSVYFVKSASGPLAEGQTVQWSFLEAPGPYDVVVSQVVANEKIVFDWPAAGGYQTRVIMAFITLESGDTMVQIDETGWRDDERGIKDSYGNAGGWMHMMCCLKAFLEYDINLRAGGAF